MPTIEYRYDLGTEVAIIENNTVIMCEVSQITLEADPTDDDMVQNEVTYHLKVLGSSLIHLRPESLTFPSPSEAVDYLNGPENFVPSTFAPLTVDYDFELTSLVWTHVELSLISGNVIQVTFDIDNELGTKRVRTFYHVLPNVGTDFSALLRQNFEVFATDSEATEYIKMISGVTPTQTPTVTPTISVTPSVTATVTPTATATPTVTPTPSSSGT